MSAGPLGCTTLEHDIEGAGGLDGSGLGTTKHLPPTLFAQYMIPCCGERVQPFVSLGVNYTIFFEEAGSDLKAVLSSDDVTLVLFLDDFRSA